MNFFKSSIGVALGGIVNTISIVVGGFLPIPILLHLGGVEVYERYVVFIAYVGVLSFASLMFPQQFADQVAQDKRNSGAIFFKALGVQVALVVLIAIVLGSVAAPSSIEVLIWAILFTFTRIASFTLASGFSGVRHEWFDKGVLSSAQHLVPAIGATYMVCISPDASLFLMLVLLSGSLLLLTFIVAIGVGVLRFQSNARPVREILAGNVLLFLVFNVTSVAWLAYPVVVDAYFADFALGEYSVIFKLFTFMSSFLTPVLLVFWTRLRHLDFLKNQVERVGLGCLLVLFGLLISQGLLYRYLDQLMALLGYLDDRSVEGDVIMALAVFGVLRPFANVCMMLVARLRPSIRALSRLAFWELLVWVVIFLSIDLSGSNSYELFFTLGFILSALLTILVSLRILVAGNSDC